jgi:putative membrane protein
MIRKPTRTMTEAKKAEWEEDLNVERTVLSAERTLLAWIRTAITMIAFGLTLTQVLTMLTASGNRLGAHPEAPVRLGLALTALGLFALVGASVQHWIMLRQLTKDHPRRAWSFALSVAMLLALFTALALLGILFDLGPF